MEQARRTGSGTVRPDPSNFRRGDIVSVAARPDNPCEVLVVYQLNEGDYVLYLLDKRTLKGEFIYDSSDQIKLARRPSEAQVAALYRPGGEAAGDAPRGNQGRRGVHNARRDQAPAARRPK